MKRHLIEWGKVLVCIAYLWLIMLFVLQADSSDPGMCEGLPTVAQWLGLR
jgi:hypothetical protein